MTDMLTADKLMVALTRKHRAATPGAEPGVAASAGSVDADLTRARSRERILLVHRTLARRRQRVVPTRRLP